MPLKPRMNMAPYVVTRSQAGTPVNGRAVAPSTSSVNITANVQPADGDTIKAFPEARSGSDIRRVFTATELYCTHASYLPDKIAIGGEPFEVVKVGGFPGHYEVVAMRVRQ